ncbi:MarR family winged helix-turn-helix transcriptional regulator [Candidatus Bipolaricaulota bacterium]|nr:MarR family winged helix-turn-helix transcriptional regulator [Candidatus Bipolaricaulota bacterium]
MEKLVRLLEALRGLELGQNPLRDVGISPPQFALLDWIARNEGARLRQIAAGLGVTPPTASVALRRLEELDLVERRPDPRDRRAVRFALTPEGRALQRRAERFKRRRARTILAPLSPAERETLVRLLEKALAALEKGERRKSEDREGA